MKFFHIALLVVAAAVSAAAAETMVFSENFDGPNLSANENQKKNAPRPGIEIVSEKAFSAPNALKVWSRPKRNVLLLFPDQLPADRDIMIRFKVRINSQSNAYFSIYDRRGWSYMTIKLEAQKSPCIRKGLNFPWESSYGIAPLLPDRWHELAICIGSEGKKYWLAQIDSKGKRIDGGKIYEFNCSNQIIGLQFQYTLFLDQLSDKDRGSVYFDDVAVTTADPGFLQAQPVAESIMKENKQLEYDLNATEAQKSFRKSWDASTQKAKMEGEREFLSENRYKHFIKIQNQCDRAVEITGIKTFNEIALPEAEYNKYMNLPMVINAKEIKEIGLPKHAEMLIITLEGSGKHFAPEADSHDKKTILELEGRIPVTWFNHIIIREKDPQSAVRDFQVLFNTEQLLETHEETKEEVARNDAFRKAEMDLQRLRVMLSGKSPWQKVVLETVSDDIEKFGLKTKEEWARFISKLAELPPDSFNSDDITDDYKKKSLLKSLKAVSPYVSAEAQQNIRKLNGLLKQNNDMHPSRARRRRPDERQQGNTQQSRAFRQAAGKLFFLRVTSSKATSGWRKVVLDSVSGDMRNPSLKTSEDWEKFIAGLAGLPSESFVSDRIDETEKERLLEAFAIVSPYLSEEAGKNIQKLKTLLEQLGSKTEPDSVAGNRIPR